MIQVRVNVKLVNFGTFCLSETKTRHQILVIKHLKWLMDFHSIYFEWWEVNFNNAIKQILGKVVFFSMNCIVNSLRMNNQFCKKVDITLIHEFVGIWIKDDEMNENCLYSSTRSNVTNSFFQGYKYFWNAKWFGKSNFSNLIHDVFPWLYH